MHLSTESGSHLSQGLNKSYMVSPQQFVTISIFILLILRLLVLTSNSSPYLFSFPCVLPENNVKLFFRNISLSTLERIFGSQL